MNIATATNFINKIIEKTKANSLKWIRLSDDDQKENNLSMEDLFITIDEESFVCTFSEASRIYLLLSIDGTISCSISPGHGLGSQSLSNKDDNLASSIKRLYNLVFANFPNIDSIMSEFINRD